MTESAHRRHSFKSYSTEPTSIRGTFSQYIEESGANALLIGAVSQLFEAPEKPENPIEWFRCYFRQFVLERGEALKRSQQILKDEIIKQESRLTRLHLEENRLKERIACHEYDNMPSAEAVVPRPNLDEEFHRYKDHPDDCRFRIKPDPMYQLAKNDILVQLFESDGRHRKGASGTDQSHSKSTPPKGVESKEKELENEVYDNYDDYPELYFGIITEKSEQLDFVQNVTDDVENPEIPIMDESAEEAEYEVGDEMYNQDEDDEEKFGKLKSNPGAKRGSPNALPKTPKSAKKEKKKVKKLSVEQQPPGSYKKEEQIEENPEESGGQSQNESKDEPSSSSAPEGSSSSPVSEEQDATNASETDDHSRRKTHGHHHKKNTHSSDDLVHHVKSEELPPLPEDPLLKELEPVDPSFWKEDFGVTKGHEKLYLDTDEYDYDDEEDEGQEYIEEGGYDSMSYLSSRGEKRRRKFRSQIIEEYLWKPDRGKSIQFDSRFDLADIPEMSSTTIGFGHQEFPLLKAVPSTVSAIPSEMPVKDREKDFATVRHH